MTVRLHMEAGVGGGGQTSIRVKIHEAKKGTEKTGSEPFGQSAGKRTISRFDFTPSVLPFFAGRSHYGHDCPSSLMKHSNGSPQSLPLLMQSNAFWPWQFRRWVYTPPPPTHTHTLVTASPENKSNKRHTQFYILANCTVARTPLNVA